MQNDFPYIVHYVLCWACNCAKVKQLCVVQTEGCTKTQAPPDITHLDITSLDITP